MNPLKKTVRGVSLRRKIKLALYPFFIVVCSAAVIFVAFSGSRKFDYVITTGSDTYKVSSYSQNVETVLEESGFSLDAVTYSVREAESGTYISVAESSTVSVLCDGRISLVSVGGGTVRDVLSRLNIELGEDDIVSVPLDSPVKDGIDIEITRVQVELSTMEMPIEHLTSYVEDAEMYDGETKVITEGQDGLKQITYKRTSTNGMIQDFFVISEEILKEPVDSVVAYGSYVKPVDKPVQSVSLSGSSSSSSSSGGSSSSSSPAVSNASSTVSSSGSGTGTITTSSGSTYSYSSVLNMTATAYTYNSGSNITSSGVPAQVGVVAALPSVLPEGTRVYIVSPYGSWEYGVATVGDRPANNIVDLFMETYDECIQFGVRDALVYVLD